MKDSEGLRPVILVDTQDFNWLQVMTMEGYNNPFARNQAMALWHLARRGAVRLINYTDFYTKAAREEYLPQNKALVKSISISTHESAAINAIEDWKQCARGAHSDSFRRHLNQKQRTNRKTRRLEDNRKQRVERGLGVPVRWNKQILDKHVAALKVRHHADDAFDHLNVKGVIGEKESGVIRKVLNHAPSNVETDYITDHLKPGRYIEEPDLNELATTREIFDDIGDIATRRDDVEDDDWVMLAPNLVIPQHDNLFSFEALEDEMEDGEEVTREQVAEVVTTLRRRSEAPPDMEYDKEKLMEENGMIPFAPNPVQYEGISKITDHKAILSQHADELHDMDGVPETARLIGASIVSNPSPRKSLEAFYQGDFSETRLAPQGFTKANIQAKFRRMEEYDNQKKWFEVVDPPR